jgi:membrane associated rhomboid family serine protease
MLFDSNYHDGFAAAGGLIVGLIVAVVVFKGVWKKLTTWAYKSPDQSQIPR